MPELVPARLESLIESFDQAGLGWCLLRPVELLSRREGDIDVLVEPHELGAAASCLAEQRFIQMRSDELNTHWLDRDEESERFLWIHVQAQVSIGGVALPRAELLGSVRRNPLPQLGDRWMFWLLLLRGLVEKDGVPQRQWPHVQRLVAAAGPLPEPLTGLLARRGWSSGHLVALVQSGSWEALNSLSRQRPVRRAPVAAAARLGPGARRLGRVVRSPGSRARRVNPPGMTVAVLGPDGAGKTTLVATLGRSLPFPTVVQYLGLTGGRIPWAERLRVPGIVFLAKLAILWRRYLRGRHHRAGGRLVLFERYVLDAAVPSGVKLGPVARRARWLLQWAVPLPDVVLLLDASGETMHRRSGEYDAAELERWRHAFRQLQRRVPGLEVIDAERPADVVLRDAEGRIWRLYRPRLEAWSPAASRPR